jgi:glycosyltransferase involved in cell wall biosynthesis
MTEETTTDRPPVSVCYVVLNEERRIEESLRSVTWAEEIVVLDSGSTDATLEICRRFTDQVFHQDWQGHVRQKNLALDRASNEWVLCLDGDEVLSPELAEEIRLELGRYHREVDGFSMPRLTRYLGRWIRHGSWYPDRKLRLFRRSRGRWGGENPHDRVELEPGARLRRLRHPILHYSYRDVSHHVQTIDSFTTITAGEWTARGVRFRAVRAVLHPIVKFFEVYIWKRGFLDGLPGFFIAVHTAYYAFLKHAKLFERDRGGDPETRDERRAPDDVRETKP